MYLCTEGRILAHADVDMSLLLQKEEWQGRSTWEFGRSGLEGDFQLRLPGEPLSQQLQAEHQGEGAAREPSRTAVVTVGAELTRVDPDHSLDQVDGVVATGSSASAGDGAGDGEALKAAARRPLEGGSVSTWSYLTPTARRGVVAITASLQRLELRPAAAASGGGGAALNARRNGVLVGITHAAAEVAGEQLSSRVRPSSAPLPLTRDSDSFRVIGCGELGEVDTEDSELLETITWKWEGEMPSSPAAADGGQAPRSERQGPNYGRGAGGALASIKVLGGSGAGHGDSGGDTVIATGVVPWPSSACSGRQHVNVKLVSPQGSEVGSCRVCLSLAAADGNAVGGRAREGSGQGRTSTFTEKGREQQQPVVQEEEKEGRGGGKDGVGPGVGAAVQEQGRVRTTGVQAEELPLEGTRWPTGGAVPRSYRMSVNLASVKDLENAAYVVRRHTSCTACMDSICM